MGNSESKERRLFIDIIVHMLRQRGIKVSGSQISRFLHFVQEQCPWFPEEGTVNVDTWEKVGQQLKTYYTLHGPEKVPVDTFSLWNLVRDALDPVHEGSRLDVKATGSYGTIPVGPKAVMAMKAQEDSDQEGNDIDLAGEEIKYEMEKQGEDYPPLEKLTLKSPPRSNIPPGDFIINDHPRPPGKLPNKSCVSLMQKTKLQAIEAGDIDFSLCFPVTYGPQKESDPRAGDPQWTPVPYKLIKELKMACSAYGVSAPYTLALVDSLTDYWMTPFDWTQIAKSCLSGGQYLLWKAE